MAPYSLDFTSGKTQVQRTRETPKVKARVCGFRIRDKPRTQSKQIKQFKQAASSSLALGIKWLVRSFFSDTAATKI